VDRATGAPPTASQVIELLTHLQGSFPLGGAEGYRLVEQWQRPRSGSWFYRLVDEPDGREWVVKVVPTWGPGVAETMFHAMVELDDVITAADIDGIRGVRPVAWSDSPPAVVMPYVGGVDMVSVLRQPDHESWSNEMLAGWVERAGAALATYHRRFASASPGDAEPAIEEVRRVAGRVGLPKSGAARLPEGLDWQTSTARRFGDYGPGNLQITADGALYLLDPPIESPTSVVHRDISNFLFEMRRQLAGHGYTRTRPVRGRYSDLEQRFLSGYGLVPDPVDLALIALFEVKRSLAMARKRVPGRPNDAWWFARLALRRRREMSRLLEVSIGPMTQSG
jgi:hypothetical protein